MVWNQTHNISWDACTLPSNYCSYIGQCDWLPISAMGQKGYMSLSDWPLKSPTWFSMRISWECLCIQFSSVQSLSRVQLFATPWIAAHQASLSITNSQSSTKVLSIESVMPSSHLILYHPLLLLPPIPPSIRVFFQWVNSSQAVNRSEPYSS